MVRNTNLTYLFEVHSLLIDLHQDVFDISGQNFFASFLSPGHTIDHIRPRCGLRGVVRAQKSAMQDPSRRRYFPAW